MNGYIYMIQDDKGKIYIGSTNDVSRRLSQHQNGHTQTTSRMKDKKLVFVQKFETLEDARKIERKLKKLKRKDYIEKIIQDDFIKIKP